jgi:ferredoxin-type protein NapH
MKIQKWRTLSRVILMVLVTVHIITWYALGIHAVGSIGIEALFAGLSKGIINAGFVFWILVFASALLLGRAFCGWFCWFGGYQELVAWGIGDRFKIKLPRHVLLYLGVIPFVSLGLKIYYTWIVNWLEGVPTSFSVNLANVEPWGGQQTGISILITLVLYGPMLMYVFGRRAWCRHLCPIGALLKVFSIVRPARVRLKSDDCLGCGRCTRICDMEIDVSGELERYGEVRSTNCNVCLVCIDECPSNAIAYTLRHTGIAMSSEAATRAGRQTSKRRKISAFDVIIALLWIGVVLAFSAAGLRQNSPQAIKALMTPGLLLAFYGLALIARRVWLKYKRVK